MADILEHLHKVPAIMEAGARLSRRSAEERGALILVVFDPRLHKVLLEGDATAGMRFPTLTLGKLTVVETLKAYLQQHPDLTDQTTQLYDLGDHSRRSAGAGVVVDTVVAMAAGANADTTKFDDGWRYLPSGQQDPEYDYAYYYAGLMGEDEAVANRPILDQLQDLLRLATTKPK